MKEVISQLREVYKYYLLYSTVRKYFRDNSQDCLGNTFQVDNRKFHGVCVDARIRFKLQWKILFTNDIDDVAFL